MMGLHVRGGRMKFSIDRGWVSPARKTPSPNFGPRPPATAVDLLVLHNISLPPGQYNGDCIEQFFCNKLDWDAHPYFSEIRDVEVSAHLLIRRSGELLQFVSLDDRAWHAGASNFCGREGCNDFSIGIELEGSDYEPFTDQQYQVLAGLSCALLVAYPDIGMDHIVGHSDIAPGRKTDPGPFFDWSRYREILATQEA
jgi:N-acetyl-anhydromuramoyl-L-alanine amidase